MSTNNKNINPWDWDVRVREDGTREIQVHPVLDCNWLQAQENTPDLVHGYSIKAPILIILGDHDFVRLEHAVETFNVIANAELAVVPDASHFALFSEQERVIPIVKHFVEKPEKRLPLGGGTGYHPGETR